MVLCLLFPANEQAPEAVHPGVAAFDDPAAWFSFAMDFYFDLRGLLRRGDLVAYKLTDLQHFKHHERGLIFKKGILTITLPNSFNNIVGPTADMKQLYQYAMGLAHAGTPRAL